MAVNLFEELITSLNRSTVLTPALRPCADQAIQLSDKILGPEFLTNLGLAHFLNKDYEEAIKVFTRCLKGAPTNYEVYNLRARAGMRKARRENVDYPAAVLSDLNRSLELAPSQEVVVARRCFAQKEFAKAFRQVEHLLSRGIPAPEQIELMELYGDAQALVHYQASQSSRAMYNAGMVLLEASRKQEAITHFQKAFQQGFQNTDFESCRDIWSVETHFAAGELFFTGEGSVSSKPKQALACFRVVERRGDLKIRYKAAYYLGRLLSDNSEIAPSGWEALGNFERLKACSDPALNLFRREALLSAGLLFLDGKAGIAKDPFRACEFLKEAAATGEQRYKEVYARALFELAEKEKQSYERRLATSHYEAAADLGHGRAAFIVGEQFRTSTDGYSGYHFEDKSARAEAAAKYLRMAASQGIPGAKASLEAMESCIIL